jgi:hypothetical protein
VEVGELVPEELALVVGSGISFEDRGGHALRGVADKWRVFAAA